MGLVNSQHHADAAQAGGQRQAAVDKFATHHFSFDTFMEAYDTFARAAETKALKVVIDR